MQRRSIVIALEAAVLPAAAAMRSGESGATSSTYVGSAACQNCHQDAYAAWSRSLHVHLPLRIGVGRDD